ncbi:N-acetylmuramoyl-L-alanine amidase family protein [Saccharicrinis aurantiacus]|uniref:N-acetylmuramoyl-L-alanine amidase family protein n=1 Tax=Saccharicrinis aurantiacus TaxID=1849719 RepID=UPI000838B0C9|nr:N-acetylmuramoyl-L-alanine amidase [Saccharicrinis aurantiacus]
MNFKFIRLFFVIILVIELLGASKLSAQTTGKLKCVVIDAGHGGKDPGAHGHKVREKDVVLNVALKLGSYINQYLPDVKVIYTRKKDVFVPLNERAEIANKANADLFISIHANYISNSKVTGTETFALGLHRTEDNLEVAKKENSVIRLEDDYSTTYEGFDPEVPESYIIFELMQNIYLDQSIRMAQLAEGQFKARVGRRSRGVKQAGFLVLRETAMPGILVELGFLSNPNEERYLGSEEGQSLLASGIFRAFRDYKNEYEANNSLDLVEKKESVKEDSITYRIQITSSKKQIKEGTSIYKKYTDVFEYTEGKYYKYTIGSSSDYDEISKLLVEAKKDVKDCFIVAFKSNKKISLTEARKQTIE